MGDLHEPLYTSSNVLHSMGMEQPYDPSAPSYDSWQSNTNTRVNPAIHGKKRFLYSYQLQKKKYITKRKTRLT
jgi:hypothetical protein